MTTAGSAPVLSKRDEYQQRVASPLQRLSGYIRAYVAAEGLAVLLVYLTAWFWIGLAWDYGFFKMFGIDWVQVLSYDFRLGLLCVLLAGLLATVSFKVLFRLLREFREPALALVLERRFPRVLGDRLITAVEMSDPQKAEFYGYSQAMVDQTIHEAAERVAQIPVQEVFNWRRLRRAYSLFIGLSLGIFLFVGVVFCTVHALRSQASAEKARREGVGDFITRFGDTATIWFERNILLYDTIWPRRAHLELLDFPGDEKRIGRDAPPPTLQVRAYKWMVADSNRTRAPEGWRPLRWDEISQFLTDAPIPNVPAAMMPAGWRGTVDEVDLQLMREEMRQQLAARDLIAVLDKLEENAAAASMSRRLRKMELPESVQVLYKGASSSNEQSLKKQGDNIYSGTLSDLKETIRFTVRGEDYYTPSKRIVVVPPPEIVELLRDEAQPAYLYYRVPKGAESSELRGKKQMLQDVPVSLTGDTSRFETPLGTNIVLKARVDKELRTPGGVQVRARQAGVQLKFQMQQLDEHTFQTRFDNVRTPIDVVFSFIDTDEVHGSRHVVISPIDDLPPEVDVLIEVIRKTNQGYLASPSAMIPFSGKVRDDRGLTRVDYAYTATKVESQPGTRLRTQLIASAVPLGNSLVTELPALLLIASVPRTAEEQEQTPETAQAATFERAWRDREALETPLVKILQNLASAPPTKTDVDRLLIKEHVLDPETEYFDVAKLNLKVTDDKTIQPHFRLRMSMTATDNNIESGPHKGTSKEKFTVLVISEYELLAEIGKEEEALHVKLEEMVNRLKDARLKMEKVLLDLPEVKPDEFPALAQRTEEVDETVVKGGDVAREVLSDYRRILAELRANRIQRTIIDRVSDKICDPLELALRDDYPHADEAIREAQKSIGGKNKDPKAARAAMDSIQKLLERLGAVLDAMGDITTINNLIARLVELEQSETAELKKLEELKERLEKELLESLIKKP